MNSKLLIKQIIESQLGRVLAKASKNGYTIAIHAGASQEGLWPGDPVRVGTMSITSPEGVTVKGGYWMDWPESHWGMTDEEYSALPLERRAALEANEQLKYDLEFSFGFHSLPGNKRAEFQREWHRKHRQ